MQSRFFTKLPAELRINVYGYILSNFRGKNRQLAGALSFCKRMNGEVAKELTQAFHRDLTATIKDVENIWNTRLPPFRVNITPYTEDPKYDNIILYMALPYAAVQSVLARRTLLEVILPCLLAFHLQDFDFSFCDDGTATTQPGPSDSPASRLPRFSRLRVSVPPRAEKVTLDIHTGMSEAGGSYNTWHRFWSLHLEPEGYTREKNRVKGSSSPLTYFREEHEMDVILDEPAIW